MKTLVGILAAMVVGLAIAVVVLAMGGREPVQRSALEQMVPPAPVTYRLLPDDELVVFYTMSPLDEGFLSPAPDAAGDNGMNVVPLEGGAPRKAWVYMAFGENEPRLALEAP